jgi:hypothetical protein
MSFLLLASSSGIAYAQHFCGDFEMLSQITIGEKHLSCEMKIQTQCCDNKELNDQKCCENQYTQINTDDNFAKTTFDLHLNKTLVTFFVTIFKINQAVDYKTAFTNFSEYNPPPLIRDIPVLHQVFII